MGAVRQLNLGIKVNGKEVEETFKSVTSQMFKLRREVDGTKEGTDKWKKANEDLAKVESKRNGMIDRQKEFRKEIKATSKDTQDNSAAINEFGQAFGKVTAGIMSGDLMMVKEGLAGMRAGIIGATKASLAFIATPLGMILAGLAIAIGAVTQYFRDSEEGQNAWNKISAVTGAIVGNLTDLLSDLGGMLFKVFSDPKQTLIDLKDAIIQNVENRITGLIKFFPRLGEAIELALSGKFKEAGLVAADAVAQITFGVENFSNKAATGFDKAGNAVKNFGKEVQNEIKRSAELADLEAKADKIERALIVERGEIEAKVAERRLKSREEDKFSATERKKFLEEAVNLERGLINKEIQAASIRRDIKTEQNSFSKSTKDDLNEEARLTAAVSALERKRADAARTLQRDLLRVDGQIKKGTAGGGKAGTDPAIAEEKKKLDAIDKLEEEYNKKKEDRLANSELKKAELERNRAVEKAKSLGAEQSLIDQITAEHQIKIDEAKAAEEVKELERLKAFEEKKLELENELELSRAETEAEKEEIRKEQELEKEEALYEKKLAKFEEEMAFLQMTEEEKNQVIQDLQEASEKTLLGIQKKYKDKKIKEEEELVAAKRRLFNDSVNAAIQAAGAESKVGQALLFAKQLLAANEMAVATGLFKSKMAIKLAEATGNIAEGASKTASSTPFPYNIPLIIGFAAQVAGIIGTIRNATKTGNSVKTSFARGGFTDLFGMGYKDATGHEVAGDVHVGEYVVPKVVRQDPEVPPILDYLENKRKKKLNLYADGGDTGTAAADIPASSSASGQNGSREIRLLELILESLGVTGDIYFGYEAEQKRQEAQKKLKAIQDRAQIKKN